jgi:hypothetical protein
MRYSELPAQGSYASRSRKSRMPKTRAHVSLKPVAPRPPHQGATPLRLQRGAWRTYIACAANWHNPLASVGLCFVSGREPTPANASRCPFSPFGRRTAGFGAVIRLDSAVFIRWMRAPFAVNPARRDVKIELLFPIFDRLVGRPRCAGGKIG